MSLNRKAIELLEQNEYDNALQLFKEAVEVSRGVQSLTNLAWIYSYEEEDDIKAETILHEVIAMEPKSHFPYSLLAEIYIKKDKWTEALQLLLISISIKPSETAYHNAAICHYHLGNIKDAATYYKKAAGKSDFSLYNYAKCLLDDGEYTRAKEVLETFSENDEDFVGQIELAELYAELAHYSEAIKRFEKGWETYYLDPSWISIFVYSLIQQARLKDAQKIIEEAIAHRSECIEEAYADEYDETWTEEDNKNYIERLQIDKKKFEQIIDRILNGWVPTIKYQTSMFTDCYLFGCNRHNNPEYTEH